MSSQRQDDVENHLRTQHVEVQSNLMRQVRKMHDEGIDTTILEALAKESVQATNRYVSCLDARHAPKVSQDREYVTGKHWSTIPGNRADVERHLLITEHEARAAVRQKFRELDEVLFDSHNKSLDDLLAFYSRNEQR